MISERRFFFRVPPAASTGSLQRATHTFLRFPRTTKLPLWYRRRIISAFLSPDVRLGSAIPVAIIRMCLLKSSTTLPLNEFRQCTLFESEVLAYLEVRQLLCPTPSGSLVHPGNRNPQQFCYFMNGQKAALTWSL